MSLSARRYLLDVGVISLCFAGQASVKPYFDRIISGKAAGLISEVNLTEYYHKAA